MSVELTPEYRETRGRAALGWVLKYFNDQSTLPVYPTVGAGELTARRGSHAKRPSIIAFDK